MMPPKLPTRRIVLVDESGLHRIMTTYVGDMLPETMLGGAVICRRITDRAAYYYPNPALAPGLQQPASEEA